MHIVVQLWSQYCIETIILFRSLLTKLYMKPCFLIWIKCDFTEWSWQWNAILRNIDTTKEHSSRSDPDYILDPDFCKDPHLLDQAELSDLIRDLGLSKQKAELIASRMRQWNMLKEEIKSTFYRNRNRVEKLFPKKNYISYCLDIGGLMEFLGFKHEQSEWRLLIDGSSESLKAVLLHNGNEQPTIPLAHTVDWKESGESIEEILKVIKYDE